MKIGLLVDYLEKFYHSDLEKSKFDNLKKKKLSFKSYKDKLDFWLSEDGLRNYVGDIIGEDLYCFRKVVKIEGDPLEYKKAQIYREEISWEKDDKYGIERKRIKRNYDQALEWFEKDFVSILPQTPEEIKIFNEMRIQWTKSQHENIIFNMHAECLDSAVSIRGFEEITSKADDKAKVKKRIKEIERTQETVENYKYITASGNPIGAHPRSLSNRLFPRRKDRSLNPDSFHLRNTLNYFFEEYIEMNRSMDLSFEPLNDFEIKTLVLAKESWEYLKYLRALTHMPQEKDSKTNPLVDGSEGNKDNNTGSKKTQSPNSFDEIFKPNVDVKVCIDALKKVEPPIIDNNLNYILSAKEKSAMAAWINVLIKRKKINSCDHKDLPKLLNKKFAGLNLGYDGRIFRGDNKTQAYLKYRGRLMAILPQS